MPTALPTRAEYYQIGAQDVIVRSQQRPQRLRLSREAIFTEGTDINIILAACAAMADEATRQTALKFAALFLDSAEGEDLDRLVADRFSPTIFRKQAAPAVVPVTFRTTVPSVGATLEVGQTVRTEDGTEFELTEVAPFPVGSTGPVTAAAEAKLSGTAGNVAAGSIVQFGPPLPADAPTYVITNDEAATGGRDVETDESLRARARDFFRTARRGTLAAIEFGALTVDGVESATAIELTDPVTGLPTGFIQLAIADSNGQSNSILAEAVRGALDDFRAAGIPVQVLTSNPVFQDIAYEIGFRSGFDTRSASQQLKALTEASVNVLAPAEPLQRSLLFALARSIPGAIVGDAAVTLPAGDVQPAFNETIKTSLSRITVNGL